MHPACLTTSFRPGHITDVACLRREYQAAPTGEIRPPGRDEFPVPVLKDGPPLAFSLNAVAAIETGQTDAEGGLTFRLNKAGAWLLRGTDIRKSSKPDTAFESHVVTLTLETATKVICRRRGELTPEEFLKGSTCLFRLVGCMDEKSLDKLLRRRGDALRSSSLPANFQQNIRREIRQRATEPSGVSSFFGWQWLLRPQFVAAMLAVAMLVGVGLGSRQPDRLAMATKQALHLDVFGAAPPTLPSTVLSTKL